MQKETEESFKFDLFKELEKQAESYGLPVEFKAGVKIGDANWDGIVLNNNSFINLSLI